MNMKSFAVLAALVSCTFAYNGMYDGNNVYGQEIQYSSNSNPDKISINGDTVSITRMVKLNGKKYGLTFNYVNGEFQNNVNRGALSTDPIVFEWGGLENPVKSQSLSNKIASLTDVSQMRAFAQVAYSFRGKIRGDFEFNGTDSITKLFEYGDKHYGLTLSTSNQAYGKCNSANEIFGDLVIFDCDNNEQPIPRGEYRKVLNRCGIDLNSLREILKELQ